MKKEIWFDMDGTIADFYGVKNWLSFLEKEDTTPYEVAKPLFNMNALARVLNRLTREGYTVNIISWGSKTATAEYLDRIATAKKEWLNRHLASVKFDRIEIVAYGTYKEVVADHSSGLLFDDEEPNRKYWSGTAYDVNNIIDILKSL